MKFLRSQLDRVGALFHKGGKLEQLYPLYEATDTFLYTPGESTKAAAHVRDAIDLKRMMSTVVVALIPAVLMAVYNTGYQANLAIETGAHAMAGTEVTAVGLQQDAEGNPESDMSRWRADLMSMLGIGFESGNHLSNVVHGLLWYLPVVIVTLVVGGNLEALFAIVRKHDINEGFLVTWMLFPLILPPTIPLWQVAVGIAFGVIVGKEVFGGTGMNILNPALTARAFLFFAYPADISGDQVWVAADGYSAPTLLSSAATGGLAAVESAEWSYVDALLGWIPGSMGETSALAALIGAVILIATRVASWRIMLGCLIGTVGTALFLNAVGSETNAFFDVPWYWHLVMGGWMFGVVFMATEPVTSPYAEAAKLPYGIFIGVLIVLIRVVNPAYPEGVFLAILLMNCFSSTFDHVVMSANIKRRAQRTAAKTPDASTATPEVAHAA